MLLVFTIDDNCCSFAFKEGLLFFWRLQRSPIGDSTKPTWETSKWFPLQMRGHLGLKAFVFCIYQCTVFFNLKGTYSYQPPICSMQLLFLDLVISTKHVYFWHSLDRFGKNAMLFETRTDNPELKETYHANMTFVSF